jgi:hypothetical protein
MCACGVHVFVLMHNCIYALCSGSSVTDIPFPYFLASRRKCYGFFDFRCHIQYICMNWIVMFGLLLAIFPTGKPSSSLLFCFLIEEINVP